MNLNNTLGQMRMQEAIRGNEELLPVLSRLMECENSVHLASAVGVLISYYVSARDIGMVWTPGNGAASAFMSGSRIQMLIDISESLRGSDQDTKTHRLAELLVAVSEFRSQGVTWTPVEVPRPEPVEVRISSLPARIIETTVTRDDEFEIVKTTQVEQDFFGAQNV